MKRGFLIFSIFFLFISGCRDYLNNLITDLPPVLITDAGTYGINDSISVTLKNVSNKVVYTKETFSYLQVKVENNWMFYASYACANCNEFSLVKDQSVTVKTKPVFDSGVYRFVCLYSNVAGSSDQNRIKLYSNEFTVN